MNRICRKVISFAFLCAALPASALAAVQTPMLDIGLIDSNDGFNITDNEITIDATVFGIINTESAFVAIDSEDFLLSAGNRVDIANGSQFDSGTLIIGDKLTAEFSLLEVVWLTANYGTITAELDYLSGIWSENIDGGRLEAAINITSNSFVAKVGEVSAVPLPGALALLAGPLLLSVFSVRRRNS